MSKCCSEREKVMANNCCTRRNCDMMYDVPKVDPVKEYKMNKHIESL